MNWLAMGLRVASRIPFERWLLRPKNRSEQEEAFIRQLEAEEQRRKPRPSVVEDAEQILETRQPPPPSSHVVSREIDHVTNEEVLAYQKREIAKELLLLERHLAQKCRIAGKPCDCCEKHPLLIEALAGETLGITGDTVYQEVIDWCREIAPITTNEAARSGVYDETYPKLSPVARNYRKRLMGTLSLKPLMTAQMSTRATEQLGQILDEVDPELKKLTEDESYD